MKKRHNATRDKSSKPSLEVERKEATTPTASIVKLVSFIVLVVCLVVATSWKPWKQGEKKTEAKASPVVESERNPSQEDFEMLKRGNSLLSAGRTQEAAQIYETCLHGGGHSSMSCASNLASILERQGENSKAEELYRKVLAAEPNNQAARFNLAMLLQDRATADASKEAIMLYRIVTRAEPEDFDAWANLAAAMHDAGEQPISDTIKAYQKAILLLETKIGKDMQAEAQNAPVMAQLYHRLGSLLGEMTEDECSNILADKDVLLIKDEDDSARSVCVDNAINALRAAQELEPDSPDIESRLASLIEGNASPSKASPSFVKALFDDAASTFNEKLANLQYVVPKEVALEVTRLVEKRGGAFTIALDAGCGTGLVGPLIRGSLQGPLIGADLSEKSLEVARGLKAEDGEPVYTKLYSGDLLKLEFVEGPFDLVLAADVLVYFGDLSPLMSMFAKLLLRSGTLVFSCERIDGTNQGATWQLMKSGRFAHRREYVETVASSSGLTLSSYREIVPRLEHGREVPGHLFVFKHVGKSRS